MIVVKSYAYKKAAKGYQHQIPNGIIRGIIFGVDLRPIARSYAAGKQVPATMAALPNQLFASGLLLALIFVVTKKRTNSGLVHN